MLDNSVRSAIDPTLNLLARNAARAGLSANAITWIGFGLGLLACIAIALQAYVIGLVLLLLSRLCDGLDGAVARLSRKTDLGGFLDIVLDFAFYGGIPLAFIIADPTQNAVAGGAILLAFYVNGASFLTYALMAEKRGIDDTSRGSKSLLYTVGLAEATETVFVFCLWCLFPQYFSIVAYIFAAAVVATTIGRFALAYKQFG